MPPQPGIPEDPLIFARKLKEWIVENDLTQKEVAIALGYKAPRVSQVLGGERPSREFVERLIAKYGLPREEWIAAFNALRAAPGGGDHTEALLKRTAEETARRMMEEFRAERERERFPRPRDLFWHLFGRIVTLCERLGIEPPPRPSFHGGSGNLTFESARDAAEDILAELREDNPEHAGRLQSEFLDE